MSISIKKIDLLIKKKLFHLVSDEDEFYDRTKKKASSQKVGENQSVETAETLLDKRDAIIQEMEENKKLLSIEKNKMASQTTVETEAGDALDAYMSGLSSQLGKISYSGFVN